MSYLSIVLEKLAKFFRGYFFGAPSKFLISASVSFKLTSCLTNSVSEVNNGISVSEMKVSMTDFETNLAQQTKAIQIKLNGTPKSTYTCQEHDYFSVILLIDIHKSTENDWTK